MLVRDLAEFLGARWEGDGSLDLKRVSALDDATRGDLSFLSNPRFLAQAQASRACLLVPDRYPNPGSQTLIRVADPRAAVAQAIAALHPPKQFRPGTHPSAVVSAEAHVSPSAHIGPHVTVGSGAEIGDRVVVLAGCSIGDQVHIGPKSFLHAGVTIYDGVRLGSGVILHSGSVIGADGFGFVLTGDVYQKFPQVGRVEIGNNVEIGANSCVDRAALGVTSIGDGTKIDNMVHVGHNCRIGKHVVIAAQTGLSGGVEIGDYAVVGGQVGVGDKARIESRAVVGSGSGILTSKIVRAGQPVWGMPARPLKEYLLQLAELSRLAKTNAKGKRKG
jgi:UDP-3-O-[3-hydroxymyristoyl] glucosamine N-acyltransferase